jgi:cleavage and polyadenylation specificity factor subunit 1
MRRNAFLGLVNFYRRFVPAAAKLLLPLTAVLSGGPAGSSKVKWSPGMVAAFKAAVAAACELQHPAPSAELSLATDASASHIAAVLQQRSSRHGAWQPLAFFSAKLSPAQINYSTFDRELLAVYQAVRHFRHMLEGCAFVIFTNHKPLVGGINRVSDPWSARQRRQLSYVAEFAATLRHISSKSNVVANALSRPAAQQPAINNVAPSAAPVASPPLDIR